MHLCLFILASSSSGTPFTYLIHEWHGWHTSNLDASFTYLAECASGVLKCLSLILKLVQMAWAHIYLEAFKWHVWQRSYYLSCKRHKWHSFDYLPSSRGVQDPFLTHLGETPQLQVEWQHFSLIVHANQTHLPFLRDGIATP